MHAQVHAQVLVDQVHAQVHAQVLVDQVHAQVHAQEVLYFYHTVDGYSFLCYTRAPWPL